MAQNSGEIHDDVSFLSISSSECEEADEIVVEEESQKDDVRGTFIAGDGSVDHDEVKSLGSLAEYDTAFNMMEDDFMVFDNYVSTSSKKKVAFAEKSFLVKNKAGNASSRKPFISGLLSSLRLSKDFPEGGAAEVRKLIGNEKDVELAQDNDSDDDDDDEIGYSSWRNKLPDERWDAIDKIDFYSALHVHWEQPVFVYSDLENPYIGLDDSGQEWAGSPSDRSQASTQEKFSIPFPMLDRAYKKIPRHRRPYVLFIFFVLVIVVPVAYGLSVAASKSTSSSIEQLGGTADNPTSSPTSSFTFQTWTQVGDSLFSQDLQAQNGFSLSLSDDGSLLAVGARKSGCPGYKHCGQVNVYEFDILDGSPVWVLLQTLEGGIEGNQFGFTVCISGNGRRLAVASVGDDRNGKNSGLVQVFERRGPSWNVVVEYRGQQEGDLFGASVSLSKDGRMLAVGAPYHSANNTRRSGQVYFFEDIGFDSLPRWIQSRAPLPGSSNGDLFGWSLGLSEDGSRLIVGSPADPALNVNGYARVYEFLGYHDTWVQLGTDLGSQEGRPDRFGYSVSISNSGSRVAIGAYANMVDNKTKGEVSVYQLADHYWDPLGFALVGDEDSDGFGYSVALSPEGGYLAVGAPSHNDSGIVQVFEYDGHDDWLPSIGIVGGVDRAAFGFSVDLSSLAQRVAIGMPRASEARVFSSQ
jgi:FG-GAP repeat